VPRKAVRIIILFALLELVFSLPAKAAAVGRFVEVEGRVDLLKQGQLPAVAARAEDPLAVGDVVRTKSGSRAVIQFVDDTLLTIAPESRVIIQEFLFDSQKSYRRAVLKVLQGLVRTVTPRLMNGNTPNFLLETHTSVMGVRGTEWYAHLSPQATDIYTVTGSLEVRHLNPQVPGKVITRAMQYTRVTLTSPPTPPVAFSPESLNLLKQQLSPGASNASSPGDAISSCRPQTGLLVSFFGDQAPGVLADYQLLDRNLLGSLRESNLADRLISGISMPPRLDSLISDRNLRPGRRDILDRFIKLNIIINPGSIVTPGFRPGIRK
jgi:FecR protein